MFLRLFIVAAIVLAAGLSGCAGRTAPIYIVENAKVVSGSGSELTRDQVRQAIVDAANYKTWRVKQAGDGHLVATVHVRRHMAQVDIRYSSSRYSIAYKDSDVLMHDGTSIHRNYNKWVMLLERQININLRSF